MKIVGLQVCGYGEADRYGQKSWDSLARLCDDVIIVGNNTDSKTEKEIKKRGFWFYRDDTEWGKYQNNIKSDLLVRVGKLKPDWVVALDADEEFEERFTRDDLKELTTHGEIAFHFYLLNLWNDEQHYAKGLSFWNIRLFRFLPQFGLQYARKPVHPGLAPPFAYQYGWYCPYIVRHYGLLKEGDRLAKVERYKKYDPNAVYKGQEYYDALASTEAPAPYDEEAVINKLTALPECSPRKNQPKNLKDLLTSA